MLCEHCGKEIPGNSKFCRYCGQPVVPQPPIPSESKPSKLPIILAALVVCIVVVLGIRQMTGVAKQASTTPAASASTTATEQSSVPELSEYEKQVAELRPKLSYYSSRMIAKELSNPDSLELTHNWDALTNCGVFITHSGTAKYLNRDGIQTTQPFQVTFILKDDAQSAFFVALKLGDSIIYDRHNDIDDDGIFTCTNTIYSERGYGDKVFDNMLNPDLWKRGPNDNGYTSPDNDSDLTLADYQAIGIGMSYDQVCKILGGPGVELSRTGSGKNEIFSIIWSNPSVLGTNISVMFKGGKVESKAQLGLQ